MTARKPRPIKKCRHCGQLFQNLARHHASEHPEVPFEEGEPCMKCEVCGLEFDNTRSHRRHMESVCGKRKDMDSKSTSDTKDEVSVEMKCETCGMKFGRLRNLRRHTSRNNCFKKLARPKGKEFFSCLEPRCGMEFYRQSDLDLHHEEKHPQEAELTRADNDYDITDANVGEDGEEASPFQCSFCPKICQGFGHKSRHERTHLTKYKCKALNCDASFNVLGKFLGHMDKFHDIILENEEVERYMNSESGVDENKPANIAEDASATNMELKLEGDGIPKLFEGKKNMRERRARNGETAPFKCQYCAKKYGKFSHRNRHELTHSNNPRPYKCEMDDCTMSFSRLENYRRHLNSHVPDELRPKFPCPYENCSEKFLSLKGLKSHKALHENGLMYSCKICMESFGKKWKLNRHLSKAHGHLKPFSCTFEGCTHRFVRKSQVQGHVRKCHILHYCFEEECGTLQPFGTRNEMYKHNKKFHPAPKEHLVCGDCGRVCYSKSGFSRHQLWHQKVQTKEEQLEAKEFACDYPFCAAVCSSKQELSAHIGEKHLGVHGNRKKKTRECSCRICNNTFENELALAQHLKDDHEMNGDTKVKERSAKKARTAVTLKTPIARNQWVADEEEELYEEDDACMNSSEEEEDIDIVYMDTSEVDEPSEAEDVDEEEEEDEETAATRSDDMHGSRNMNRGIMNENVSMQGEKAKEVGETQILPPASLAVPPAHELFPSSASLLLPPMHELFPAPTSTMASGGFLSSHAVDALLG